MAEQYNDAVEKLKDPELRKKYEQEQAKFRDSMMAELEKRERELENERVLERLGRD